MLLRSPLSHGTLNHDFSAVQDINRDEILRGSNEMQLADSVLRQIFLCHSIRDRFPSSPMPAEARVTPLWKKQKLFVSIFLFAFASYFFFDGAVGYPRANKRYQEWKSYHDTGRLEEWPAYAQQKGWKVDEIQKFLDDPHQKGLIPDERWPRGKILEQYVCGGVVSFLTLITFGYWLSQKDRTVRTDGEAVFAPSGKRIPFAAITGLGKKRWEAKGLATVRYEIEGRRGEFQLDDYKFDRDATHQIVAEIEEKLATAAGK
jgi:hypothetical protein